MPSDCAILLSAVVGLALLGLHMWRCYEAKMKGRTEAVLAYRAALKDATLGTLSNPRWDKEKGAWLIDPSCEKAAQKRLYVYGELPEGTYLPHNAPRF